MVTVCLVGAAGYAGVHFSALMQQIDKGNMTLAGVAIRTPAKVPERIAELEKRGIPVFSDTADMFKSVGATCDIACLPTAIHTHVPLAVAAMEAGMHVFVEKPLCATVDEFAPLFSTQQKTGKWVAVGYQSAYGPNVLEMKRRITSGEFGALQSVRGVSCAPRATSYYHRNSWAGKVRDGEIWVLDSPYNNAFAHQLNLLCFFAGVGFDQSALFASVQAELYRARPTIENADIAAIRAVTDSGIPLLYLTAHAVEKTIPPRMELTAEKAKITWDYFSGSATIDWNDGRTETVSNENMGGVMAELTDHMYDMLAERVGNEKTFICTARMAAAQTVVMNGAHMSSPIVPIANAYLQEHLEAENPDQPTPAADRIFYSPDGIMTLMEEAMKSGKLFSELHAPWACPGKMVDVRPLSAAIEGKATTAPLFCLA